MLENRIQPEQQHNGASSGWWRAASAMPQTWIARYTCAAPRSCTARAVS